MTRKCNVSSYPQPTELKHVTTDCKYHSINPFTLSYSPLFKHIWHDKGTTESTQTVCNTTWKSYHNLWDCWENPRKSEVTSVTGWCVQQPRGLPKEKPCRQLLQGGSDTVKAPQRRDQVVHSPVLNFPGSETQLSVYLEIQSVDTF